jgi:PAS domain S-box-containing protein
VMVDGDGRIVLLNRQIEQLFGYRREALIGRPIEVLIPPRFRMHHPSLRAAYQKTPETMMPIRGRNLHGMRQDGGEFPVEIELNPIETGNGPMTLASVMDLTERKRAEDKQKQLLAELTESQKHFEQIFHWTPSAVAISTLAEGRFLDVNDRLVQLTGYSREELIGHTTAELQLWADPLELARVIQEILQQRSPHNEEGLLRTKSGELRTIMVSVDRIQVKATPCLIYVAHDITERKQAEIVQARQYEALQAIFRMTVALSRASSLEELYEQGIDGVQRALKVDRASILLFNEDGVMRFKASRGLSEEYKMALEGHSPWSRETVNPQPMLVEDVVADPSVAPYRKIFVGEGIAALGFIPLVSAEGLLGKFMLYYDTPHQFTEEEIQIAQTIASHVALMIQRKRAVETLRHSERQLRTVLDSLPIGVWFTDRTGKTLLANPAAKQIWSNIRRVGLQTQDNPSGWWETLDPVTEPHRWALSHALTTGEASLNETLDLEDVDGRRKTIRNTTVPVKDESGTTIGAVILNEDLTDLRRIQEALKLTQFSVDHAVEAFFWIGPDANILHVNEAACRMLEYTSDELTNMTVHDIDPNFPLEAWAAHWEELKQKGALTFESKHWSRTGRVLDTEVTVNYLQYEGSEYNCAIIRDIGERKQAEEALRQSEERFRLLVEGAPLGITLLDEHFCYVKVNQAFCNLVGYREEEILGQTSALFIHSDDRTSNLAVAAEANRGERASYRLEKRYIRKNKQPIWVTVNATSLPLRGNTDHHVVAIIEDITERKRLAEREASRIRQLKKLSELSMTLSGDPAVVFDQVVRIIGELFNIQVVCLSEIVGEELHFKSVYIDGQILRSEEHCPLAITPCATVAQAKDMRIFDRVMERFPQATFLKDHEAHMYCGFPALDSHGTVVAVTCLLDNNLHEFAEEEHELLRIIGQRIAVEIERSRHISEKQQAEDALRQNHALLSAIMDATMDIVFVKDLEGRYLHMNPAGARVVGLPPQEIIGKDDDAIFPADLAACCKEADRQILSTRSAQTVEESTMAGGRRITYLTTKAPYRDAAGHMIGIIGVAHDISQIKQSEEDLRRSHALIRQIIDTDPNFIFAKDREGHFTLVNKAVAEAYGTSVERLIGKTDADFSSNTRELEFFRKKDLEVLNSLREQFIAEEMFTDSTGRTRWLQTVKRPILDESGQATMVLGASTDITERKRIEEALRQRERDLRTALDERERISQDLHDGILQSLYAVGLGLEACKPLMTQRHYKKAAASMDRAIGQLNHVMSEVRNFIAGLESQILQGSTFPMALRTMVLTLTADHPIPCTLTIDESLANTFSTEQALHLLNVVREALSNSLRHAGATKTTVSLKSLSRSIRLTIADNGRGFNPASMHGAGHGLTNMEARARKVGGRIAIRSVPQQGTRITIDLPKETRHAESESEHGSTAARR